MKKVILSGLAIAASMIGGAQAALVQFNFEGKWTETIGSSPVNIGDSFNGYYIFDDASLDTAVSATSIGVFQSAVKEFGLNSGSFSTVVSEFLSNQFDLIVVNDVSGTDRIQFAARPNTPFTAFDIFLNDSDQTALSSESLMAASLFSNLSAFEDIKFFADFVDRTQADGIVTNTSWNFVDPSPVPVPAALPLMAMGLGGLGFIRHRRARLQNQ